MNKEQTYYFLGNILALDITPAGKENIVKKLDGESINWKGFVKTGSDNLVLPAVYLKLKDAGLTSFLPPELDEYLVGVLNLNRERNVKILQQAEYIKNLLLSRDIHPVFLKGTANLVDGLYKDIGERMLYDIDILVEKDKMLDAAALLRDVGFFTQKKFISRSLESTMHYPILLREDFVAGVEIHRLPVQYLYQTKFESVWTHEKKKPSTHEKGFWVMGHRERIIHNFLHAQLMHSGHYHGNVSLRDLYDLLLLGQKENLSEVFREYGYDSAKSTAYLKLMHKVFGLELPPELTHASRGNMFLWRHHKVLQLSSRNLKRYHLIFLILQKYVVLPGRVIWNKTARNYVWSRLTDKQWYRLHIKGMKRNL